MKTKKELGRKSDWLKADAHVLGRILAAQNIEFTLPITPRITEFFAETLITIPGIISCRVCLEDVTSQRGGMETRICEECPASRKKAIGQENLPSYRHYFRCSLADQPGMQFVAVDFFQHHFGLFVFQIDDPDIFNIYKPFISNLANYAAIGLENLLQSDLLSKVHGELDFSKSEQMEELRNANENLIKEITVRQQTEESLYKSEEDLRAFFSQTVDGCFYMMLDEPVRWDETVNKERVLDYIIAHQRITKINDAMLSYYASMRRQIVDLTPNNFFEHDRDMWQHLLDAGKIQVERYEQKLDGTHAWIEGEFMVLYDSQGWIIGHLGIQRDITAHKRAEKALHLASLYSRKLIETSLDPLVTISKEGNITDVNTATEKITGMSRETLIGSNFADYFTDPEMARNGYLNVFERGQVIDFPLAIRHTSGSIAEVLFNASVYKNEQGEVLGVFATARDITERKRVADELNALKESLEAANLELQSAFKLEQKLAHTDVLTGIYNRRYLLDLAEKELAISIRYQQPLAVILFDLDHFKEINDCYGHAIGDQILQLVTQVSCANIRTADVIGRYGGDEFVIVLPMTNSQQAYTLAERIRKGVAAVRVPTEKGDATVTLSTGIVEMTHYTAKSGFDSPAETVDNIILHADEAMYAAKKAGLNCIKIYSVKY